MNQDVATIRSSIEDGIGWIVIDNPARRNALTRAMFVQLGEVATTLDADPAVRVLVMRGAGDKAFISGGDISEFDEVQKSTDAKVTAASGATQALEALSNLTKPLIAMINGHCLGGGMLVALEADLRIASDKATFGIPAAKLGVGYPYATAKKVVECVGPTYAAEILLLGDRVTPDRALTMGLLNKVVGADQVDAEVRAMAKTIANNAPLTMRGIKRALRGYLKDPAAADNAEVAKFVEICTRSQDFREGSAAFLEKRAPQFRGE